MNSYYFVIPTVSLKGVILGLRCTKAQVVHLSFDHRTLELSAKGKGGQAMRKIETTDLWSSPGSPPMELGVSIRYLRDASRKFPSGRRNYIQVEVRYDLKAHAIERNDPMVFLTASTDPLISNDLRQKRRDGTTETYVMFFKAAYALDERIRYLLHPGLLPNSFASVIFAPQISIRATGEDLLVVQHVLEIYGHAVQRHRIGMNVDTDSIIVDLEFTPGSPEHLACAAYLVDRLIKS